MATNKKPRKKYKGARVRHMGLAIRGLVMTHRQSMDLDENGNEQYEAHVNGYPNMSDELLWHVIQEAATKYRRWIVSVYAEFDTGTETYLEEEEYVTKDEILLNDLQETYIEAYNRVKNAGNPKHFKDAGWVARPYSDKLMAKIIKKEGAAA